MNLSKKNTTGFYIDGSKGLFFSKSSANFEITFPKDILAHLEIVDSQKLSELISKFIETKKIQPSQIFIILGKDTTFEKDLTDIPRAVRYTEIQKFLDIVPFEKTLSKIFKIEKKEKIVVANRHFCEELTQIFNQKGFKVYAIAPLSIILDLNPKLKDRLDLPLIYKKIDTLKKYNLLASSVYEKPLNFSTSTAVNSRLIILVSVFTILIIVLGFMVYTQILVAKPKAKLKVTPSIQVQQPTSKPFSPEATSSVQLNPSVTPLPFGPK